MDSGSQMPIMKSYAFLMSVEAGLCISPVASPGNRSGIRLQFLKGSLTFTHTLAVIAMKCVLRDCPQPMRMSLLTCLPDLYPATKDPEVLAFVQSWSEQPAFHDGLALKPSDFCSLLESFRLL